MNEFLTFIQPSAHKVRKLRKRKTNSKKIKEARQKRMKHLLHPVVNRIVNILMLFLFLYVASIGCDMSFRSILFIFLFLSISNLFNVLLG